MSKPDLMAELRAQSKWLRKAAAEIAAEGHAGWGNTCLQAAEVIDTRHNELEAVVRDAARYRWLCDKFGVTKLPCAIERIVDGTYVADGKAAIDEAIDQAMHNSAREGL